VARPHRLQAPGAVYHVTARGAGPCAIFLDDSDRQTFLALLADVVARTSWNLYAYCLMQTHFHLLLETPEANLADGMRRLNGLYATSFNRRHARVGHLFQGRYHSVLVQTEGHLLEIIRYIALNPVKAGQCERPDEWQWGSYKQMVGDGPLARFLSLRAFESVADDPSDARSRLRRFVEGPEGGQTL
jgi:putative transposase